MNKRFKYNGKPFGIDYADCLPSENNKSHYKGLVFTPYYSGDSWTVAQTVSGYKIDGVPLAQPPIIPGTFPQPGLCYTASSGCVQTNYVGDGWATSAGDTVTIERTDQKLVINGNKTFTPNMFYDGAVPSRLLVLLQAGGGSGGGCNWNTEGGGGGGGAGWVGIIRLDVGTVKIEVGAGGGKSKDRLGETHGYDGGDTVLYINNEKIITTQGGKGGSYGKRSKHQDSPSNYWCAGGTVTIHSHENEWVWTFASVRGGDGDTTDSSGRGDNVNVDSFFTSKNPANQIDAGFNWFGGLGGTGGNSRKDGGGGGASMSGIGGEGGDGGSDRDGKSPSETAAAKKGNPNIRYLSGYGGGGGGPGDQPWGDRPYYGPGAGGVARLYLGVKENGWEEEW